MKNISVRRIVVMVVGIIFLGLGIALFKLSLMGNDPSTALAIGVMNKVDLKLPVVMIIMNSLYFIVEILFGRKLIGIGTFVNWFGVGTLAAFWEYVLTSFITFPEDFWGRFMIMAIGIVELSFAVSLYQTPDVGIAPYDALAIILDERTPLPYFWCRMIVDSSATLIAFVLGAIVNLGTLACAFGLGPFISLFSRFVAEPLCGIKRDKKQ